MSSLFDTLLVTLQRSADYNRDDTVPPAAVLWPDEKREWEKLVPRLRTVLPQFLTCRRRSSGYPTPGDRGSWDAFSDWLEYS
jgi:hypothetical protein